MIDSQYNGFNENNISGKELSSTNHTYLSFVFLILALVLVSLDAIGFALLYTFGDIVGTLSYVIPMSAFALLALLFAIVARIKK